MNTIIKEAMMLVAATIATFSVSAQTEELWLDKYETKSVIDTIAADSMDAAMNAAYNAEQREYHFQAYAGRYLAEIALIDQLIAAEENEQSLEPISSENRKLYAKLREFDNKEGVTKKDLKTMQKYKVPKGFSEKILKPAQAALQEKIDQFEPPAEEIRYNWRKHMRGGTPPKKEVKIHTRVPNPECRDNYFNGNLSPKNAYRENRWDEAQQSKGWEWINRDEMNNKEVFFPQKISYMVHPSHPEYRFTYYHPGFCPRLNAYDENGKLVRADNVVGEQDYRDIEKKVMESICKRDFLANKYDINRAEKKTLDALRIRFGIVDGVDERFKKYKEMYIASRYAMVNAVTPEEYGQALAMHDASLKVMKEYALKQFDNQADNYVKQLESDHNGELAYIYKIERVDNVTFKIYYMNDNMECSCIALMKWSNSDEPYQCEYEIELLPCETITIRR